MQIARIIFTAATARHSSALRRKHRGFSRFRDKFAGISWRDWARVVLVVVVVAGVARRMCCKCCKCCSILGSSVGSFALHSIYYVCVYLPVAGYFHCQIYFKWVQLSAQRFLFAFRICSLLLFPLLSFFLPLRAKMLRSLRIFHTHTQRRQGCTATDTFAIQLQLQLQIQIHLQLQALFYGYSFRYGYGYSCTYV